MTCSSGTYIRAIARDLGAALGTGGHLTALRRTRVGPYRVGDAATAGRAGAATLRVIPLAAAAAAAFDPPRPDRRRGPAASATAAGCPPLGAGPGPVAAFAPDGTLVALLTEESTARPGRWRCSSAEASSPAARLPGATGACAARGRLGAAAVTA